MIQASDGGERHAVFVHGANGAFAIPQAEGGVKILGDGADMFFAGLRFVSAATKTTTKMTRLF